MIETLGLVAAVVLPLWNIPLILQIRRRRSSKDISRAWAFGVFACLLVMLPGGLRSPDPVYRVFTLVNGVLFPGAVLAVLRYR